MELDPFCAAPSLTHSLTRCGALDESTRLLLDVRDELGVALLARKGEVAREEELHLLGGELERRRALEEALGGLDVAIAQLHVHVDRPDVYALGEVGEDRVRAKGEASGGTREDQVQCRADLDDAIALGGLAQREAADGERLLPTTNSLANSETVCGC